MARAFYILLSVLIIAGYGYAGYRGMEMPRTKKGFVPADVRGAHGGARTFWYGGYRGGK